MYLPTNCLPKSYSWWNLNLNVSDAPSLSSAIRYHILVSTTSLLVPTTYRFFSRYNRKLYQSSSYPSTQYTLAETHHSSAIYYLLPSTYWPGSSGYQLPVSTSLTLKWPSNQTCDQLSWAGSKISSAHEPAQHFVILLSCELSRLSNALSWAAVWAELSWLR